MAFNLWLTSVVNTETSEFSNSTHLMFQCLFVLHDLLIVLC